MAKKKHPMPGKSRDAPPAAAPNMFETIWSRRKFDILGKKQKGEGKRVAQLRSRGIDKRKKTLLREYKVRHKSNSFVDRRFGENNENMGEDEKAIMRFQRERQAKIQKKNKFAIPDIEDEENDILTHRGAALSTLDDFEEDVSGDDDDEPQELDEKMVKSMNFGGGGEEMDVKEHKSKKEVMEEIIAKSKHYKALKAKQKEEDSDLREKLDSDFKLLANTPAVLSLMRPKKKGLKALLNKDSTDEPDAVVSAAEEEKDEYDKLKEEMLYAFRAPAGERLKTTEEIAKEEMERLEELEKKRIQRMTGAQESDSEDGESDEEGRKGRKRKRPEVSGDDLGENFVLEEESGKGWVDEVLARRDANASGDEETEDESGSDGEASEDEEDGEDMEADEEEDDDDDDEEELAEAQEGDEAASEEDGKTLELAREEQQTKEVENVEENSELPFVMKAPQTLEEFRKLVRRRSDAELELAIQRIRTCNAISFAAENRKKMQIFYNVLLLYFSEVSSTAPFSLSRINILTKPLIEMSSETPYFAAVCARERLIRMQKQLSEKLLARDEASAWPSLRTVLLMRLWSLIFPASDFRHVVVTPLMLLLGEYLLRCPVKSGRDVVAGSFLCSLALSIMKHAGRLCPEALSFLLALLSTGLADDSAARNHCPQFLKELVGNSWLRLRGENSDMKSIEPLDFVEAMTAEADGAFYNSDAFRVSIINVSLQTLKGFLVIYSDLPSCPEIFRQFLPVLLELSGSKNLPACLKTPLKEITNLITERVLHAERFRQPLRMRLSKPTPIKQFNPKFEEDFVKGKDYDIDRDRAERKKLQRQIKREAKGAARELRKDSQFLAVEKNRERTEAEQEREEKYKKAMSFLEEQEAAAKSGQLGRRNNRKRR